MSEVHIWRADLDAPLALDPADLPVDERERAASLPAPRIRARWTAARVTLRHVLAHYLDESPSEIALRLEEHGKPVLAELNPRLHFNLSHSGDTAVVAVSREREVGIDLEEKIAGRDFLRLAEVGLDAAAAAAVAAAQPRDRAAAFYAAWVRREAIAKCHGTGLAAPPPADPVCVIELNAGREHAAAVAVAGDEALPLRRYAAPPA